MQFDSCHGTTFLDFEDVRVPKANLIGEEGERTNMVVCTCFKHHTISHLTDVLNAC